MEKKKRKQIKIGRCLALLEKAEAAVDSIKPKDITELKGVQNAVDNVNRRIAPHLVGKV